MAKSEPKRTSSESAIAAMFSLFQKEGATGNLQVHSRSYGTEVGALVADTMKCLASSGLTLESILNELKQLVDDNAGCPDVTVANSDTLKSLPPLVVLLGPIAGNIFAADKAKASGDDDEAWASLADAKYWLGVMCATKMGASEMLREHAKKGAAKMLEHSPKQAAKTEAFGLYQEWQSGKLRFKSGAAFALHFISQYRIIESPKTVERWVTRWRKELKVKK